MSERTFYIVDVFAEDKYSGNQLAVVTESDGLSTERMLEITQEMHFSETTFICSDRRTDGGFAVRIFTPRAEVPFAGHPTLGTAYVLSEVLGKVPAGNVLLNLGVGQVPVTREGDLFWMTTKPPSFGRTLAVDALAPVLNLGVDDFDPRFPIRVVSTGLPFIVVPLKTLEAVRRARIHEDALAALDSETREILVFTPETYSQACQLNVRVFCPLLGVVEDPATGSGNSCLAGYLSKHRFFGSDHVDVQVEQGIEIDRPSRLYLKAKQTDDRYQVQVGGKVQLIAKGVLV